MITIDWQDHPDEDVVGVFWVRWRGKYTTRLWHASIDGRRSLCHIYVRYPLYVGRAAGRCSRCQAAAIRLNAPE